MSKIYIKSSEKEFVLSELTNKNANLNSKEIQFELKNVDDGLVEISFDNQIKLFSLIEKTEDKILLMHEGEYYQFQIQTEKSRLASKFISSNSTSHKSILIKAPMPGLVIKILKSEGDKVKKGEPLIILEAMKMENELTSPVNGIIKKVFVKENNTVEKGNSIILIE